MLVGHSMGGVVARVALARQRRPLVTRVVQMGAPNHGSYAPVLALRGVYPTVRKLAALDRRHSAEDLARLIFRTLPALHELLPDPLLTGDTDLFDAAQWPDDALRPQPALLAAARSERARWPGPDPRCLHIVGVRQDTVVGVEPAGAEFDFNLAPLGDGTVPLRLAVQPGDRAWFLAEKHGGLPNNGRAIAAVIDLLRTGDTDRLARSASRARAPLARRVSAAALRRVAPHKVPWQHLSPDARRRLLEPVVSPEFHGSVDPAVLERAFLQKSAAGRAPAHPPRRRLEIRLVRGSIADANARALVLGVFQNVAPAGPAAAIDTALDGAVRELALRRMFAAQLGQVFVMPVARGALLAEFVVFAGLGEFDEFGAEAPAFVTENVVRTLARSQVEDFATVLFGAGSGLPAAMAAEQLLRGLVAGVLQADAGRVVRRVSICEVDARKYAVLVRATRRLVPALARADLELVVDEVDLAAPGPVRSPSRAAPGRHRLSVPRDPAYLLVATEPRGRNDLACRASLLTAGAKAAVLSGEVVFAHQALRRVVDPLERGAAVVQDLAGIGTALADLLLPPTVRAGLESMQSRPLVIVHDREAARVPWEVLRIGATHPALAAGLSRRYATDALSVARWREDRLPGPKLRVLLVVDPTRDLPGAAAEGTALVQRLSREDVQVERLAGREATRARILAALHAGGFGVLHFAGHAFFDAGDPARGGLVCDGDEVLRGADLATLGNLPALVFCNACEAARVRRRRAGATRSRAVQPRLGGLAEGFLTGGVANFIGTHWPVGDDAASAFSQSLYESLLDRATLGAAVLAARRRLHAMPSVDWADYVHYGSPEFRLDRIP
jgi:hypothetical protein